MKQTCFLFGLLVVSFTQLFAQTHYVINTTDHVSLHVNEFGTGKPVILLAGGPGLNAKYVMPICQKIDGYRFIVPDQRGSGASGMAVVDSLNMSTDKHVEDLEALRIHLKLSKLVLCGHSWGGMLAFAYAAKYPDRVERMILLGSGGITAKFFAYFGSNIQMRLHQEDAEAGNPGSLKSIWPGYFFNRDKALATRDLLDGIMNPNQSDIYKYTIRSYRATDAARLKGLGKYKNPVIAIQGRQDPVGESTVYETRDALPQTKFFFIEKCGHLPWLEGEKAATEFYQLLGTALKG